MRIFPVILHVDMDAFFASVEQRDRPELRGLPVIVGSPPGRRGVVCAASYEARAFGVHSAMPSNIAQKRCPKAIFLKPDMERYRNESIQIMRLIAPFGDQIEQVSVDEAYLDVSLQCQLADHDQSLHKALDLARKLKDCVKQERGLTISVGIGGSKLMAKIASDFDKPDGLILIPERDKVALLGALPIRRLPGVGKVTEEALLAAGIDRINLLKALTHPPTGLSVNQLQHLQSLAEGRDDRSVRETTSIKRISSENTFDEDTEDRRLIRQCLRQQANELSGKLLSRSLHAQGIQVKVRYGDYTTLSRQISLTDPIQREDDIYRSACRLLGKHQLVSRPLRLIGIGVYTLRESPVIQLLLPLE